MGCHALRSFPGSTVHLSLHPMPMNRALIISTCLLVLGTLSAASAQEIQIPGAAPAGTASAAAPARKFTDAQVLEAFGWFIGQRMGLTEFDFTTEELDTVVKGMRAALAGKDPPHDLEQIAPQMDAFVEGKQARYMEKLRKQNQSEAAAFFAKLKENKNVTALPSGLCYEIVQPGSGAYPKAGETVKVNYTGKFLDGEVFDSSEQRGQPAEFALATGMIPGFVEGMQKINTGGKIRLYLPAKLGYGDNGAGPIPPAATLIFDIELLEIKPAATTVPAPAPEAKK